MNRPILVTAAMLPITAALMVAGVGARPQAAKAPQRPQLINPRVVTPAMIKEDLPLFGWQLFAFVNWPELPGNRGVPDSNRSIGDPGATVWESFKNVSEVYQDNGERPVPWEVNDEIPDLKEHKDLIAPDALAALGPVDSKWIHFLSEPYMIDGQQVCDANANPVIYEVRGDRPYYNYVVNNPSGHQLYNVEGQLAALADSNFTFNFPTDALEVKASWRILGPNDPPGRYWTAYGVYYDTTHMLHAARIGLTGLHIISKALPNWVWITFEQVDNPTATYKYFLGQKGAALGPNPNYDQSLNSINQKFQQALAGTKWQYYALMKVQTEFVDTQQQPILMSNTQMETYFQPQSSCISCHNLASIGNPQGYQQSLRLQLFPGLKAYVGNINFQQIAAQQYPGESFKPMDFTWSLRNAHHIQSPAPTHKPLHRPQAPTAATRTAVAH